MGSSKKILSIIPESLHEDLIDEVKEIMKSREQEAKITSSTLHQISQANILGKKIRLWRKEVEPYEYDEWDKKLGIKKYEYSNGVEFLINSDGLEIVTCEIVGLELNDKKNYALSVVVFVNGKRERLRLKFTTILHFVE